MSIRWLRYLINLSLAIALGGLIAIALFYTHLESKERTINKWLQHTYQVIDTLDKTISSVLLAEVYQRNYLITQQPAFENLFLQQKQVVSKELNNLSLFIRDNPSQVENLIVLSYLIEKRIQFLEGTIRKFQNIGFDEAIANIRVGAGNKLMHEALLKIKAMKNTEIQLLEQRKNNYQESYKRTKLIIQYGFVLGLVIIIASFIILNNFLISKEKAEKAKKRLELFLSEMVENVMAGIVAVDNSMNILIFNTAYQEYIKKLRNREVKVGMNLKEIFQGEDDPELDLKNWRESLKGRRFSVIHEMQEDDKIFYYNFMYYHLCDENGLIIGATQASREITDQVENERKIERVNVELKNNVEILRRQNLSSLLLNKMISLLQICKNEKNAYEIVANYAAKLLPNTSGSIYMLNSTRQHLELVGKWNEPVLAEKIYPAGSYLVLKPGTVNIIDGTETDEFCIHVKEEPPIVPHVCLPLFSQGQMFGVILVEFNNDSKTSLINSGMKKHLDILLPGFAKQVALALSNIRLQEYLREQTIRDPLTNLYNRRMMEDFLVKEILLMQREKKTLAVMIMDIDHFKNYNDKYGHDAGDYVLQEFAKFLNRTLRKSDAVCRYGGEEFAVIMPEAGEEQAVLKAQKIRDGLTKLKFRYNDKLLDVFTVSQGIALYPADANNASDLLKMADQALYAAKEMGRDRVVVYKEVSA